MPKVYNAIYDTNSGDYFTPHKRAFSRWRDHNQPGFAVVNNAGQFVLPGGDFNDPHVAGGNYHNDVDFRQSALRELTEEIGLTPEFNPHNNNVTRLLFNNPASATPRDVHFNNYVNAVQANPNFHDLFAPIDVYEQNIKRFRSQPMVGNNEPLSNLHVPGGNPSTHGALYLGIDPQDFNRLLGAYAHVNHYDEFIHNNPVIPQGYKRRRDEELSQIGINFPNTHTIPAAHLPAGFVHPATNSMSQNQATNIFRTQHHLQSPHVPHNPHGLAANHLGQQG